VEGFANSGRDANGNLLQASINYSRASSRGSLVELATGLPALS
jgi:hypothetical protein